MLPGRGNGTFGPGDQSKSAARPVATTFALTADLNNDGKLDAIIGDADSQRPHLIVVPGNGDLSFNQASTVTLTIGPAPLDGVAADFTGDRRTDLAVVTHDNHGMTVFRNQGSFSFAEWNMGLGRQVNDLAAADFNRDGKMDLVAASLPTPTTTSTTGTETPRSCSAGATHSDRRRA